MPGLGYQQLSIALTASYCWEGVRVDDDDARETEEGEVVSLSTA